MDPYIVIGVAILVMFLISYLFPSDWFPCATVDTLYTIDDKVGATPMECFQNPTLKLRFPMPRTAPTYGIYGYYGGDKAAKPIYGNTGNALFGGFPKTSSNRTNSGIANHNSGIANHNSCSSCSMKDTCPCECGGTRDNCRMVYNRPCTCGPSCSCNLCGSCGGGCGCGCCRNSC